MKIAFVSNFLSVHQQPVCDALFQSDKVEFRFIATNPLSEGRKQMGWSEAEPKPYELRTYSAPEQEREALAFSVDCDVLIIGHDRCDIFFSHYMKNGHGILFRCGERVYKNGRWRVISPRGLKLKWDNYFKHPKDKLYMLCSSAYAAGDHALLGAYINRCYKWGYFPPFYPYDIRDIITKKEKKRIFWAGRMLNWKHPEAMIHIAKYLREAGMSFQIDMAGDGPLFSAMEEMIREENLGSCVRLLGSLPVGEVREHMLCSGIFVTTSDYGEGWGAVVNEAMNSGCAVVACKAMGAVPFLIRSGDNGFAYKNGRMDQACVAVENLLRDVELQEQMGVRAYQTIANNWNAQEAAKRLVSLSEQLLAGAGRTSFADGPCSRARVF